MVSNDVVDELQPAPRHMMDEPYSPVTAKEGPLAGLLTGGVSTVKEYVSPGSELTRLSTHERGTPGCKGGAMRQRQSREGTPFALQGDERATPRARAAPQSYALCGSTRGRC